MQQIKIFKGLESDLTTLEETVNAWIVEQDVRVVQLFGNLAPQTIQSQGRGGGLSTTDFAPSDVMLVLLYEK